MPGADRVRPARGGPRWLVPVVIVVAALAFAGGMVGRRWYERSPATAAAPTVVAPSSAAPAGKPPGSPGVRLTKDAVDHPRHQAVRDLLQRYFDAVNAKSYRDWRTTVTSQFAAAKPRSEWSHSFRTTRDGSIVVYRIETGGRAELRVLLSFVSTQDVQDAPPNFPRHCIRWRVVFPLALEHGAWKIAADKAGSTPRHDAC